MIARLKGRVVVRGEGYLVVQVGGVGFRVYVPLPVLARVGELGEEIELETHLHVRENELSLYGFESGGELALFRLLLGVTGVGPKLALTMLSGGPLQELRQAIASEDVPALTRIPGIGRRTAERIVLDLRDKIVVAELVPAGLAARYDPQAVEALASLGYSATEARAALEALPQEELSLEEQILWALRHLGT